MSKKKKKKKLQIIDYFIITCLVLLVFCIIILIFDNGKSKESLDDTIVVSETEKVGFKLNGKTNLTVKKNSEYKDRGFAAFSSLEDDISEYVSVKGNVDTDVPGVYKIYYTLEYKTISKTLERTVEVIDKQSVMINGDAVVYVLKGSDYKELGVSAKDSEGNELKYEVKIDNKVDISKTGNYYVNYEVTVDDVKYELMRKVVVYDMTYELKANTTAATSDKVILSFNTENNYYAYTIYNDKKTSLKKFDVEVYSNMKITYKIYDIFGNYVIEEVDIKNINKNPLNGTCNAIVSDSNTVFSVTSNKNISNIEYFGAGIRIASVNNANYTYNGKLNPKSNISVKIYDTNNKNVSVNCKITDKTTSSNINPQPSTAPQFTPLDNGKVVFSSDTDTMKVNITKVSSYYITRVWMKNPHQQVNKFDSPNYGTKLEYPSYLLADAVAARNLTDKTLIGFNASGFYKKGIYDADSVKKYPAFDKTSVGTIVITNGQVVRNAYTKAYKTWYTVGVDPSNTLRIFVDSKATTEAELAEKKLWADSVINSGIRNTFTFAGPLVIDGKKSDITDTYGNARDKLSRQAICQVDANNFVLITGTNLNLKDLKNIMLSLNCKTGTNLDGGGSIALLYKEKNSTEIKRIIGNGRALPEIGYFSD